MPFEPEKNRTLRFLEGSVPKPTEDEQTLYGYDPAYAKVAYYFRTDLHITPNGSINTQSLATIVGELDSCRADYNGGDSFALIRAIKICCTRSLPMPDWLALAFAKEVEKIYDEEAPLTLDQIFPYIKGKRTTVSRVRAANRDWRLGRDLAMAAWKYVLANPEVTSLDAALEKVLKGGQFGSSKTKARALLEYGERVQAKILGKHMGFPRQSLSDFLKKRRKN